MICFYNLFKKDVFANEIFNYLEKKFFYVELIYDGI